MARILVNLLSYTGTKGGMETYTRELYREVGARDTGHEFVGFASTEFMTRDHGWFPGEVHDSGISGENRWAWAFGEMFAVTRGAKRHGADLVHSPLTLGPWRTPIPAVYTMHDMLYFRAPDLMAVPFYTKPVQWLEKRMAPNAALILTDSVASKEDIELFLGQPADRIRVVPLAGTPPFSAPAEPPAREPGLLLAVGNRLPHKNFEGIVRALALIPESSRPRLIVTGSRGDDPIRPVVDELELNDWVELKSWVDDDELEWLYLHATALIDACFVNGFCLPALEAMLVGLPVLMSDIPVYHEVGGDAVGYFDPTDHRSMAATMTRAVSDPAWVAELSRRGREQAARFSWAKVADETLQAFDDALVLGPRRGRRR
ncbi:glycosyltransferase family 1 protein [Galbitalea sp. SE-J8]|uniref:glycosyltransferase family 4 protein n=1 Tax=Galbitalea sp. SE-J8 TaxID=3054952 RepID=UPI00259D2D68|nr:glycosyltransferase family 1 protein [Galbitalea sp. SE-J8]MDM4762957.1 glycosyltransferase family 1 protein [Galbitalea sp. SE-J8]